MCGRLFSVHYKVKNIYVYIYSKYLISSLWLSIRHTSQEDPLVQNHHCKGCIKFLTSTMATHVSSRSLGLPTWHDNCVIITLDRSEIIKYERREGDGGEKGRKRQRTRKEKGEARVTRMRRSWERWRGGWGMWAQMLKRWLCKNKFLSTDNIHYLVLKNGK